MSDKYRVGIIGCGSIAGLHVQGYRGVEEVEIVAIADPVEAALNDFGERNNIQTRYLDAREMLDKENLDIVSVATWHRLHAPMTIAACARKPKAILCEKPMATNLGECDDMLIAAQRNNVKVAIAHQRRFNPVWTDARQLIANGAIGEPRQIVCRGGQGLLNDCSHLFDMMRYVLGDPDAEWVIGNIERKTERYERDIPIEDRSAGIIGFQGGCIGLLLQEIAGPQLSRWDYLRFRRYHRSDRTTCPPAQQQGCRMGRPSSGGRKSVRSAGTRATLVDRREKRTSRRSDKRTRRCGDYHGNLRLRTVA